MSKSNNVKLGDNVSIICKNDQCSVFRVKDESGDGLMTCYPVFPGIELFYNDFHMQRCCSKFETNVELLCIDHCREGRLEWETTNGSCVYIGAGDLHITTHEYAGKAFNFPLNHYHGITIGISIEDALPALPTIMGGLPIDIIALRDKFQNDSHSFFMRAGSAIEHIFSELYTAPESFKSAYQKIKITELLLFLSASEIPANSVDHPYFSKSQVEKSKSIRDFIIQNIATHYPLEVLSQKFDMPLTNMKLCFKGIYGTSIYAYTREYRMKIATGKLQSSNDTIATIASNLGYDNASKFAAAFKAVIGKTPAEYRKIFV